MVQFSPGFGLEKRLDLPIDRNIVTTRFSHKQRHSASVEPFFGFAFEASLENAEFFEDFQNGSDALGLVDSGLGRHDHLGSLYYRPGSFPKGEIPV